MGLHCLAPLPEELRETSIWAVKYVNDIAGCGIVYMEDYLRYRVTQEGSPGHQGLHCNVEFLPVFFRIP